MLLVEPLGLLQGCAATQAIDTGLALPLAGGPSAFSLVRLIGDGPERLCPVGEVPPRFRPALGRVSAGRPDWAGLAAGAPWVMGILNVTPDSFSDGGVHAGPEAAIQAGLAMAEAGASLVDVGGETTRPHSSPTPADEERARIVPVVRALAARGVRVSVDTRNAATMQAALAAGALVINDVSALMHDPEAAGVVARARCPVVLMHMRGTPATMHHYARYSDVAVDVTLELAARIAAAEAAGVRRADIAVDPGIGFAKRAEDNLALLPRLSLLLNLGCPIVVGVSRKGFIGGLAGETVARRRGPGSLAAGLHAALRGAALLRVHDVAETVQAVRVWRGLGGLE